MRLEELIRHSYAPITQSLRNKLVKIHIYTHIKVWLEEVRALVKNELPPAHSQVTSPYSYTPNKSRYYCLRCAVRGTEAQINTSTRQADESQKYLQPQCDAGLLATILVFAILVCISL